jgi:hypothetical protein
MQRFILVDHSITGLAGHHYEYAVHVLRAAQRAGYEPILVTNRKFHESGIPWEVLPIFEFGFWPEARSAAYWKLGVKVVSWLAPRLSLARIRWRFSEVSLAWASRYHWDTYLRRRRGEGAPLTVRATAVTAIVFFQVIRLLLGAVLLPLILAIGIPAWICFVILRFSVRVGEAIVRGEGLALRRSEGNLFLRLTKVASSLARPGALVAEGQRKLEALLNRRQPARPHQAEAFGRDAGRLLRKLRPRRGDVIFFPTISEHDLGGLARRLDKTRQGLDATWHFLFRRNIYTGTRADYPTQDAGLEELRLIFELVQRSVLGKRSFFYTDTEELTEQYDRLGLVRFHTLPVPHTYAVSDRITHSEPLRLTYLGDARTEKGFALIPELAAKLEAEYLATGRAKLVLQCNYNIPGGEPNVAIARGELESMAGGYIEFFRRPLTSEEYRTLLLTADLNLLCYDAANYYARSSGILVESLAVGIPVIAPSGCWLSRQFLGRHIEHIQNVRAEMTSLGGRGLADISWRDDQNVVSKLKPGEVLRVHNDSGRRVSLDVPHGATHVVLSCEFGLGAQAVSATVCEVGWDDEPVVGGTSTASLEAPQGSRRGALLIDVRPGVPKIALSLRAGHPSQTAWLTAVEIEFLRAPEGQRLPKGAVGLIYHSTSEIPALVADLIDHYPHYQRTAAEFSTKWREYHNPDRLVRELEAIRGIHRGENEASCARTESVAV